MLIQLITRWLAAQSPARRAAIAECNRRIGLARYHARRAMVRAALIEHLMDSVGMPTYAKRGPGYLPAIVWRTLPYIDLRAAL